jgi:lysine 2,3-aminomutase
MSAAHTLRTIASLAEAGLVPADRTADLERVAARYAVAVTPLSAALINTHDPADPIARQFLPDPAELDHAPEEEADPVGDLSHSPVEGIVHRYPDRVLLMLTHTCATYCRFCFRRERVGQAEHGNLSPQALDAALTYIASNSGVWEVILTGGDPLVLSPRRLGEVMQALNGIEHVKVVRLHTRIPAVAPETITPALIAALKRFEGAVYVALHANHPRELTGEVRSACARMIDAGLPMLSQTVLLKGVNDDPATLAALMRAFVETRIKPYYLHHGDLAPGTAHLRTSIEAGQGLMRDLRGNVSGLCQPTFIFDIPGGHGKVPVGPSYLAGLQGGGSIEDPWGRRHVYPPKVRG